MYWKKKVQLENKFSMCLLEVHAHKIDHTLEFKPIQDMYSYVIRKLQYQTINHIKADVNLVLQGRP